MFFLTFAFLFLKFNEDFSYTDEKRIGADQT